MKTFKFVPQLTHHGVMQVRTEGEIENEPILYQADFGFALEHGGPITREFLTWLPKMTDVIIDTRVHMLMQSWTPAIPGFHLDHVPRTLPGAQPDLSQNTAQEHYMAIVGAGISSPEFVIEPITLQIDETKPIYQQCNEQINKMNVDKMKIADNNIWKFSSQDFHRATPAIKDGWRFLIRASFNTGVAPKNKIRKQTQVYMDPNRGW
jgi:hypothetical protein